MRREGRYIEVVINGECVLVTRLAKLTRQTKVTEGGNVGLVSCSREEEIKTVSSSVQNSAVQRVDWQHIAKVRDLLYGNIVLFLVVSGAPNLNNHKSRYSLGSLEFSKFKTFYTMK